jgi:hypothetical protein
VTLTAGGRQFQSLTDSQGRYSFRSPSIPAGPATIAAGGVPQNIDLHSPVAGLALRSS